MQNDQTQPKKRKLRGTVVSTKMDKTVVVRVDQVRTHPVYQKKYTVSRRFKVHDETNQSKVGDVVDFVECRPLSKQKRWRLA